MTRETVTGHFVMSSSQTKAPTDGGVRQNLHHTQWPTLQIRLYLVPFQRYYLFISQKSKEVTWSSPHRLWRLSITHAMVLARIN